MSEADVLERLTAVLDKRKQADPNTSYVAGLYEKGLDTMLKKIGEEATETIMAAKDGDRQRILQETADLWFHCLVMLVYKEIDPRSVLAELDRRFGQSGMAEKIARIEQA